MAVRRYALNVSVAAAALLLSGCLAHQNDPIAMSSTTTLSAGDDAKPKPVVMTVKQIDQPSSESDPGVGSNPERIPTAAQIFDFHPPGSKANTWRQPFEIEDHGGPLEIYRKQTAAMLKQLQDPNFQQTAPQASPTPAQAAH